MEDIIHTKAKRPEAQDEVVTSCQEIAGGYETHVMFQLIILEGKLDGRVKNIFPIYLHSAPHLHLNQQFLLNSLSKPVYLYIYN